MSCQHGDAECSANIFEQCGIYLNPDQNDWFPFYYCVESVAEGEGGSVTEDDVKSCASDAGIDGDAIVACHDDPEQAWALQLAASQATDPNHECAFGGGGEEGGGGETPGAV